MLLVGAKPAIAALDTRFENSAGANVELNKSKLTPTSEQMISVQYGGIRFKRARISNVWIHYQEAGDPERPTLLLLHGFPSTSHMWNRLIPSLAPLFHIVAPDYPGFGLSDAPLPSSFDYTFDTLALTMTKLMEVLRVSKYTLIVQDYGGPVGFRMALANPERLQAIVAQNIAAYDTALGPTWETRRAFWQRPTANLAAFKKNFLSLEAARTRHVGSSPQIEAYDPALWQSEFEMLCRPGMSEIHTALFYDYRNNVADYPRWQTWMQVFRPKMLVTWGKYDLSFAVEGAAGFSRDNPNAEVHVLNAGHFPLDEAPDLVCELTVRFLQKHLGRA